MLLRSLKLCNIRSYVEETITFPQGSILLAGDIGTGKSTLLLAIEFALFGTARPDLPAEALLRKGCTKGFAELAFQLDGQLYTIRRELKKEKNGIKQASGHLVVNNVKQDLMPIELKAAILTTIGYPEEFLTKNKNYIYRYTIYTPQEEMKAILLEEPEMRLDTLRKIFNLDKYKTVRENCQLYTRYLREELRRLEGRTETLEELKKHEEEVRQQLLTLAKSIQEIEKKRATTHQLVQEARRKRQELEERQQKYIKIGDEEKYLHSVLEQQEEQLLYLVQKKRQLEEEKATLRIPPDITLAQIETTLTRLEEKKIAALHHKASLQERATNHRSLSTALLRELAAMEEEITLLPEKEVQLQKVREELVSVPEEKKVQLDSLFAQTIQSIARNETLLLQTREFMEKMLELHTCPLCLQEVPEEHKRNLLRQESEKRARAEKLLQEFRQKKADIEEQRMQLQQQERLFMERQRVISQLLLELEHGKNKIREREKKQVQWKILQQELGELERELAAVQQESALQLWEEEIRQWREQKNAWLQQRQLEKQLQESEQRLHEVAERKKHLEERFLTIKQARAEMTDLSPQITLAAEELHQLEQQERVQEIQEAELRAHHGHFLADQEKVQGQLSAMEEEKKKFLRDQELHHWLEEYFMKLTFTIEKHLLASTHSLFNQFFREWFSILIDDETMQARIDDSFYPAIEINGYDVPYAMLSGGEKTSAALAYRLALNKVINEVVHTIKTKDLLILDEPTDGFSSEQLDKVRDVLERLGLKQIILVSHEAKVESFVDHVMRVHKEGGVSKVES